MKICRCSSAKEYQKPLLLAQLFEIPLFIISRPAASSGTRPASPSTLLGPSSACGPPIGQTTRYFPGKIWPESPPPPARRFGKYLIKPDAASGLFRVYFFARMSDIFLAGEINLLTRPRKVKKNPIATYPFLEACGKHSKTRVSFSRLTRALPDGRMRRKKFSAYESGGSTSTKPLHLTDVREPSPKWWQTIRSPRLHCILYNPEGRNVRITRNSVFLAWCIDQACIILTFSRSPPKLLLILK